MMKISKLACFVFEIFALSIALPSQGICQDGTGVPNCSKPVILELLPSGTRDVRYVVDGKSVPHYPLNELAKALNSCGSQRPLFVVADHLIPLGKIAGAVMPKLQAEKVRYFIRYPEKDHLVIEIKIVGYDSKLP